MTLDQPVSIAERKTAVPTPVMYRKERQIWNAVRPLSLVLAVAFALPAAVLAGADARRTAVVAAVEKVQHAVVSISSEKLASSHSRWPFSPEENRFPLVNGMGSGVLVDGRGYIMTNHHVVDKVQGVVVAALGRESIPGANSSDRPHDGSGAPQG